MRGATTIVFFAGCAHGIRLRTCAVEDHEIGAAIDRLTADRTIEARLRAPGSRLQASPGMVVAADRVERPARTGEPVTR